MSRPIIGRRTFVQATGAAASAILLGQAHRALAESASLPPQQGVVDPSTVDFDNELNSYNEIYGNPPLLGRIWVWNRVPLCKEPSPSAGRVKNVFGGQGVHGSYIAPIYRAVRGEPYSAKWHSDIWFETIGGYLHSGLFIPSHEILNEPETVTEPFWGEVTIPEGFQHPRPTLESNKYDWDHYKLFYGQVHRVMERVDDEQGHAWYRIHDDVEEKRQAWVLARNIKKITPEELAPISPDVEDKRILINVGAQTLHCYEEGIEVFQTKIASGDFYESDGGETFDFRTPSGLYHVQRKRPSRRMRGAQTIPGVDDYDLGGVPFCTYFSFTGAAVHGAFWHNNFGIPRTHGCINVLPDAAKWIFRWTQPYLGYDEDYRWVEEGERATPIEIIA